MKVLDDMFGFLIPQEHITTVTAADNVFALWAIEIDTFHCNTEQIEAAI